ncbi:hypothetical protein BH23BAC1_BH23BAC1_19750 [soil metagenome]
MSRFFITILLFFLIAQSASGQGKRNFELPAGITSDDFEPDVVVVKMRSELSNPESRSARPFSIEEIVTKITRAEKINKVFPQHQPVQFNPALRSSEKKTDLSLIYKIRLQKGEDLVEVINKLLQQEGVEYAEPYYYIRPLQHIPNDPDAALNGNQGYLKVIKAYEAWEITKGDTNVVIGVLDTGYNPDHEDLKTNLKFNFADPINNIDDDNDGFLDNYSGWDFANNDNKPIADKNGHGTEVLGISSASSNNGKGISGTGYNSKFMPIKIYKSEDDTFSFGYEAIVYAADKGCKVMNLSWGSPGVISKFVQDIINYAVLTKDVVIVAAAGNTPNQLNFYPASYQNVLSVGATDLDDNKASWATYSYEIDIMAPGQNVYTTKNNGAYGLSQGSSMSAPMVAGAAALVRAKFPSLNALQIKEKLRITADDIYNIPYNQTFEGKLGKGRLNMKKAVSNLVSPAIRMEEFSYNNGFGPYAFFGDTVLVTAQFKNFLDPASNCRVTLSSSSPYVTVLASGFNLGSINTLQTKDNLTNPFKFVIHHDLPPGEKIAFKLSYDDGGYTDFQFFEIESSPDYVTLGNESVSLTISGNGNLGYFTDDYNKGQGFVFNDKKLLERIGLMIATGQENVYNNVINQFSSGKRNKDFKTLKPIKLYNNGFAHIEARSQFEDNSTELAKINLKIEQKLLAFKEIPDPDFLILEYRITNMSGQDFNQLYTGLFADWDLNNLQKNRVEWDQTTGLTYIFDPAKPDLYAGMAILTEQDISSFALLNESNHSSDIAFDDLFTRPEKYKTMTNGTTLAQGMQVNDYSQVISGKTVSLNNTEAFKIAFALVAGTSLENLKKNLASARKQYAEHMKNPPLLSTQYICEGESATINPSEGTNYRFYGDKELQNLLHTGTTYKTGPLEQDRVFYLVNIDHGYNGEVMQSKIIINRTVTDFKVSPDSLIITEGGDNWVQFSDISPNGIKWSWDFGNGYGSTSKDPKIKFNESGTYNVKLVVENNSGCKNTIYKTFKVLKKSPEPILTNQQICQGEEVFISAKNSSFIRVFALPEDTTPIYEGPVFEPEKLSTDTTFFISNSEFEIESIRKPVTIRVSPQKAAIKISPDPDLTVKNKFIFKNSSLNSTRNEWYINGIKISEAPEIIVDYSQYENIDLKFYSWNPENCQDSVIRNIEIKKSASPVLEKAVSCNGKPAIVAPGNGINFYFYEDPMMQKLLHKGSNYITSSLTKVYVTGVDNFLESDPLEVKIFNQDFNADFSFEPQILNLSVSNTVTFTDISESGSKWHWNFGNGLIQNIKDPVQNFDTPGEYLISLIVDNDQGCQDTITKTLMVVNITSIPGQEIKISALDIYPNPFSHEFSLSFTNVSGPKINIEVVDALGKIILEKEILKEEDVIKLNLEGCPSGVYHLKAFTEKENFFKRIIKNP